MAVWATRDRAEAAETRVKNLEAEVRQLRQRIVELTAPTLALADHKHQPVDADPWSGLRYCACGVAF